MQPLAALWIGQTAQMWGVEAAIQLNALLLAVGAVGLLILRPVVLNYEYMPNEPARHAESQDAETPSPAVTAIEPGL